MNINATQSIVAPEAIGDAMLRMIVLRPTDRAIILERTKPSMQALL